MLFPIQIFIETQPSHPFFVYGKGWASYSPDGTIMEHGLKCQLLEVGDVCISLTPRERKHSAHSLSRKQSTHNHHTIPTTATSTARNGDSKYSEWRLDNFRMENRLATSNQENGITRKYNNNNNSTMAPPPPPLLNSDAVNGQRDEAIDATMHSRKRRSWSVPDICDEQKKIKPN